MLLHPDDSMLWDVVHPDVTPSHLHDGDVIEVAGVDVQVLHTRATPLVGSASSCRRGVAALRRHPLPRWTRRHRTVVLDFPTILDSIRGRVLSLPGGTRVLPGHGDETTVAAEAADYDAWVARGH